MAQALAYADWLVIPSADMTNDNLQIHKEWLQHTQRFMTTAFCQCKHIWAVLSYELELGSVVVTLTGESRLSD